jgi:hypothetical protein
MRHIQIVFSAAVCGALLVLAASASAQTFKPGVATIVRIWGEASYSLGNGNWQPLVVGKALSAGAVIQTSHDSMVDVVLGKNIEMRQAAQWPERIGFAPDPYERGMIDYKPSVEQNMVRITGDTTLAIDKLTISDTGVDTVSDTELDLKQGRIFCSVKKFSAASQYLVKIPNGIAGVRGTLFEIDASGWCAVYKDSVLLSIVGPNGVPVTYVVGEGNQFNPQTGQIAPLPPELTTALQQVFTALDTLYVEVFPYAVDRTQCRISPTEGHHSGGGGGGGHWWWPW